MVAEPILTDVATAPILEADGITKHFPVGGRTWPWSRGSQLHAVDDVSLALHPGRITALVGESGSGKSTVARLLAEIYPLTAGEIRFHGNALPRRPSQRALRGYRSQVQMIFQDPFASLNPIKTVQHHVARPLKIHRIVPRQEIRRRVHELLTTVGLSPAEQFAAK
ncbi:MAG TPA: ATP-binding cassette domain-containing protein, partial [Chloroflexota bacterium]|nr:ATP-binding cassette domain-containing protein [Chloroflexota bacterium]